MRYREIIEQLTLEEKASLMSGANFWNTKSVERIGVPSMMLTDGPHGLRKQGGKADNLGLNKSIPATCYPTASGLANSWDEELLEEVGRHLGLEAASEQVSVLLGPGCNIKRDPRCGRNFEYFSEDPYLAGKMSAALIRGIQENGISACVKHYAANSQELLRMTSDSVVDERTLREIYLPAFEMSVKEGGVKCLMTSYNKVNGVYANENKHLLQDILYGEWGYQGMVVSDWGGNNDRVAAIKAGSTLEMPSSSGETDRHIVRAVQEGRLQEAELDREVDKLLHMVFDTQPAISGKVYNVAAHHSFAAKAAEETAVLLKNEGGILPLSRDKRIAVIGEFALRPRYQGAGSSRINPTRLESGLECLEKAGANVIGFARGFDRMGKKNWGHISEAVKLAEKADVVLLWLGLDDAGEAEGVDREHLRLPENQIRLLEALEEVNENIVVVLSCGSPVEMHWDNMVKAVLHAYLGGQAGAATVARLILGDVSPSGKLAETVPLFLEDMPAATWYPGREATAEYREGIFVGYRYFDTAGAECKYPFGFGLSYTSFEYSELSLDDDTVSFTVKNTGAVPGAEVAQLYVSARTGGMFRPAKELKGFARAMLQPGESRRISITLNDRSFAVWSVLENDWVIEPGEYDILIGASSQDIRLKTSLVKEGPAVENPYTDEIFRPYYRAEVHDISGKCFNALLGYRKPDKFWDREDELEFNSAISQGSYLKGGAGKLLYNGLRLAEGTLKLLGLKEKANDLAFITNLPYRNIARMSGLFTDEQMKAFLKVVNREKGSVKELIGKFK